jgi:uncharacterized membrane protein
MNPLRIVGIVLLILGIILFIVGLNASDSVADRMSNFFTGRFTETTMWYMIGGIVLAVGGGLLAMFGGKTLMR